MSPEEFEKLVGATWDAMPARFKARVENVALLIEDEPGEELRKQEDLGPHDTLLGLYRGVPATVRGESYGVGGTIPDTITLFRLPLLQEAARLLKQRAFMLPTLDAALTEAVRETLWHEVGHYFGLSEHEIDEREEEGTNAFDT